jgi:hypothetical protein
MTNGVTDEQIDRLATDITECIFTAGFHHADRLSLFELEQCVGSWNKEELTQAVKSLLQGALQK